MKTWMRKRRIAVAALAVVATIALLGLAAPALAAGGTTDPVSRPAVTGAQGDVQRQVIVEFGDPVFVASVDRVETVVSIGGDVTIAGTVDTSVVAVGGDVTLLPSAQVGPSNANDASVVVVNGELIRKPGATVNGGTRIVDVGNVGDMWSWASENGGRSAFGPIGSFITWLICTVVFLLLGLIAAAVMPGQLRAVERHLSLRPAASLGWGALTFVLVPITFVVLAITIIGLLVVIPAAIALPFFTFFVVTAVGTYVVERLFATQLKGNLTLAVVIAVLATSLVVQIPVLGGIILFAMILMGTGAAMMALAEWRRRRKAARLAAAALGGPGGPGPGAGASLRRPAVPGPAVRDPAVRDPAVPTAGLRRAAVPRPGATAAGVSAAGLPAPVVSAAGVPAPVVSAAGVPASGEPRSAGCGAALRRAALRRPAVRRPAVPWPAVPGPAVPRAG